MSFFFPIVFAIYYLLHTNVKNLFLLIASIVFYMWGAPKFIFAILVTTTLDFYLVKTLYNSTTEKKRKLFLVLSICLNVGMLFYFKYCNFFIDNANAILHLFTEKQIQWTKIILPIGISFYTFESLTYVIDVYRKVHKPLNNFWQYQMYILMFPKLIAGPIIRYHEISDQITGRLGKENADDFLTGFFRFVIGLSKKVLIANTMAAVADDVFKTNISDLNTPIAWLGMLAYTFQIYFDFSGYSDMAIGMGKMLGFKFPENFNNPYTSGSITEFWRRWHMTLGSWMKNYLYIPLGGNKVDSKKRLYFNLWLVFLLSGFWHGAAWTFIFWGIYHGVLLIAERVFLLNIYKKLGKIIPVIITFLLVAFGWVFFRADSFKYAAKFIIKLFSFNFNTGNILLDTEFIFYFILAFIFSFFTLFNIGKKIQESIYFGKYNGLSYLISTVLAIAFFMICLGAITSSTFNPFIYFRF
ncbi:MAG TPA: MBOAT family O-acyltransferase [Bacteroidia bacterium]|nr:MBOAT family O-acyltransferase [Bacteroidia bacterium]